MTEPGADIETQVVPCAQCGAVAVFRVRSGSEPGRFVCPRCVPSPDEVEAAGFVVDGQREDRDGEVPGVVVALAFVVAGLLAAGHLGVFG